MSLDGKQTAEESHSQSTPPHSPQSPEVSKLEVARGETESTSSAFKTTIITMTSTSKAPAAVPASFPNDQNSNNVISTNIPSDETPPSSPQKSKFELDSTGPGPASQNVFVNVSPANKSISISPDERRSTFISADLPRTSASTPVTTFTNERTPQSSSSFSSQTSPIRPQAYSISPSSGGGDASAMTNGHEVTVIKVQSGGDQQSPSDNKTNPGLDERQSNSKPKELKEEGVAITRINVTGGFTTSEVNVSNVNGNPNQNQIQDGRSTTRSIKSREGSQRSLRLGRSEVELNEDDDDGRSEVSSVVNNPSIISQAPDRYGFMGGDQYTHESEPDPPPEIVRRREMKWLHMLDKWDHYMKKDFKTVRSRCRKGIPRSVRGRAWYYLCGAAFIKKKNPDLFHTLCQQEGKPECVEDIKKDLHRQFPWHEIFAEEGHGQKDLFNVLKAHSILNAKDGYCQAQAPIAAILLMHMPSEDAFWCLVAICEKYLKGYYSPGMQQLQLDGDILFGLLKRVAPPVYKHMKKQKIDPVLYMTEWFLCAFTRTLPWPSVLRVWDTFLCEGVKILFRVGLVLLKYTLGRSGVLKQCPNMYDTLMMLKNLPNYVTHEQFLVVQVYRLDMSDDQMRREHYKQVVKRKKAQQKAEAAKKAQEKAAARQAGANSISTTSTLRKSHETAL